MVTNIDVESGNETTIRNATGQNRIDRNRRTDRPRRDGWKSWQVGIKGGGRGWQSRIGG